MSKPHNKAGSAKSKALGVVATAGSILLVNALTAACPVCIIAIGTSAGLSRYLGIDDTITGTWLGALAVTLVFMAISALDKKNIQFFGRNLLVSILGFAAFITPLWVTGIIGDPANTVFTTLGVDKILFGMTLGTLTFILAGTVHKKLKEKNNDKSYFPFQKVAIPVASLLLVSVVLFIIFK